ncbi:PD-(D/E)XK nuclease family protein [Deltaproteobacteria bacterium TL4]
MKIIFGMHLDGPVYPDLLQHTEAVIGVEQCGPKGLLKTLEVKLGLGSKGVSEAERIEQYRHRLQHWAQQNECFYRSSLAVDSTTVALTLLSWRDDLILYGWKTDSHENTPARLKTLAMVEELKDPHVPELSPGFSDRMRTVLVHLPQELIDLQTVHVTGLRNDYPAPWLELFSKLEESKVQLTEDRPLKIKASGDLGQLQKLLLAHNKRSEKRILQGDGSLVILRSASETQASDVLSNWLFEYAKPSSLLIVPEEEMALDQVLMEQGLPSLGINRNSKNRPVLQLIPLAFALRWEPLNPFRLLEFLSLPENPLSQNLSRRLAEVVAAQPGIGGELWNDTIDSWLQSIRIRSKENQEKEGTAITAQALEDEWIQGENQTKQDLTKWLQGKRFNPEIGIPRQQATEWAQQLKAWAHMRLHRKVNEITPGMSLLVSQLSQLIKLIAQAKEEHLNELLLQHLIDLVQGRGTALSTIRREAGHIPFVNHPEAVIGEVDQIIWYDFVKEQAFQPFRRVWNSEESAYLAERGILLPSLQAQANLIFKGMRPPFFLAKQRLILVIPEKVRGDEVSPHPLYELLSVCFENLHTLEFSPKQWLEGRQKIIEALNTKKLEIRKLPEARRWWKLSKGSLLEQKNSESYSSLDALFYYPFKWVLQHQARLESGTFLSVDDGNSLKGNLAHRIIQELLKSEGPLEQGSPARLEQWLDHHLPSLLNQYGAVLQLPGREMERTRFAQFLTQAARTLVSFIKVNGWQIGELEKEVSGMLNKQPLKGRIDLLLYNQKGEQVVVDLKWGGTLYRKAELEKNQALQLTLYARMLNPETWPHQAYFILSDSTMLAPNTQAFKEPLLARMKEGESPATLWLRMEKTLLWRWEQLQEGWIEVPVAGTFKDHGSFYPSNPEPPDDILRMKDSPDRFNDFDLLTGY